jgi:flavin-dependent dehydrogenase
LGHTIDVAVVGAGPAAATIAMLLTGGGLEVALIEVGAARRQHTTEVLSPRCVAAIADCLPASVFNDSAVARSCSGVESRWFSREPDFECFEPAPAYLIDRAVFNAKLLEAALAAGVQMVKRDSLREVKLSDASVRLAGVNAHCPWSLDARFVVDATGRSSFIARRLGVSRRHLVRQVATIGNARRTSAEIRGTWFRVEAGKGGWWTAAPEQDGKWGLAFYTPASTPRLSLAAMVQLFRTTGLARDAGDYETGARVRGMDAGFSALVRVQGHRWVAIGDAAVAFDPIASQGIWHAIGSARAAAKSVEQFLAKNDSRELASYEFRSFATLRHHASQLHRHYEEKP